jgi:hypothetical protein
MRPIARSGLSWTTCPRPTYERYQIRGGPTPMPKKSYAVHALTPASLSTLGGRRLGDGPATDLDTR